MAKDKARPPRLAACLALALVLGCLAPSSCMAHSSDGKGARVMKGVGSAEQLHSPASDKEQQDVHPFQHWLHSYLRGIGKELSESHSKGNSPGTHFAENMLRDHMYRPEHIILAHTLLNETEPEVAAAPIEPKEIDINSNIYMEEGEFQAHADQWMRENRTIMEFCLRWMLLGSFIFLAATSLLIYSEVRMVLITREIDACIVAQKQMDRNLAWRKDKVDAWRGYMTFGAIFFLIVGICMILFPLCRMAGSLLLTMGYVFSGCYPLAFCMALLVAFIWALFVVGLCWSCTRPWTALILIVLSLLGEGALETGAAPAIVLWVVVSLLVGWVWIKWGKSLASETPYTEGERERLMPHD